MIKLGLVPGLRVVAISAFLAKLAVVCVVFGMTVIAGMFCFPIFAAFLVAGATVGLLMLALQFKISEAMIELVFVQPDYPGIGSLVIAVAGFTIEAAGVFVFTVEALLVAYIQGHRFMVMTAKTEFFLCRIAHSNMAICTL
jgi:hypothetical protein